MLSRCISFEWLEWKIKVVWSKDGGIGKGPELGYNEM